MMLTGLRSHHSSRLRTGLICSKAIGGCRSASTVLSAYVQPKRVEVQNTYAKLRPVSFFDNFRPYRGILRPWTEPEPWSGPPPGWAPGWVPWCLVVLRSADVHAVLTNVEAFRTGVCFTTVARFRPGAVSEGYLFENYLWELPEGPRLGVRFVDGRKAIFDSEARSEPAEPTHPVLTRRGGGFVEAESEGAVWLECRRDVWLWPLPPPGQLSFVTAWPETGITETSTTVDAGELIEASFRSEQLWEVPAGEQ